MAPSTNVPIVSVVIVSHQGEHWLRKCLSSVLNANYRNLEVIFVDNGSTDRTVPIVKEFAEKDGRIRAYFNSTNWGLPQGRNFGAQVAKGRYLVFLDQDTVVERGWMEPIVELFQNDSSVGVVQSLLLSMRDGGKLDSSGDFIDYFGRGFSRNEDWGGYDCYDGEEIFSARGAALAIRSDLAARLGYFDADFLVTYDDVDLCWRARLAGYRVVLCPKSRVYHYASTDPHHALTIFHSAKNLLMMLVKNYGLRNLIAYNPIVLTLRRPPRSTANALIWVFCNMRRIFRKRAFVQTKIRTVADSEVKRHMLSTNLALLILLLLSKISRSHYVQLAKTKKETASSEPALVGQHANN